VPSSSYFCSLTTSLAGVCWAFWTVSWVSETSLLASAMPSPVASFLYLNWFIIDPRSLACITSTSSLALAILSASSLSACSYFFSCSVAAFSDSSIYFFSYSSSFFYFSSYSFCFLMASYCAYLSFSSLSFLANSSAIFFCYYWWISSCCIYCAKT